MGETKRTLPHRKRGAQPQNKNAMKHGLYAERISKPEGNVLEGMKVTDIEGEIAYMRVMCARIARILEHNGLDSNATQPLGEEALKMLNTLDKTLTTLITYVRQYAFQTGEKSELD